MVRIIPALAGFLSSFQSKVETVIGDAKFVDAKTVEVNGVRVSGERVLIAVGGRPHVPTEIRGAELGVTSDGFFDLEEIPKKTVIVGAGYIAVELAGILSALGSEAHLLIRFDRVLRTFDSTVSEALTEELEKGLKLHKRTRVLSVTKKPNGKLSVETSHGAENQAAVLDDVDCLIWAIGRIPNTESLNLDAVGVKVDPEGHVLVDDFQNTSVPGVFAIGDVCGRHLLTPVAIAAGRRLAHRLFNGETESRLVYQNIPTVVFSHPPLGTVGLTEGEAGGGRGSGRGGIPFPPA